MKPLNEQAIIGTWEFHSSFIPLLWITVSWDDNEWLLKINILRGWKENCLQIERKDMKICYNNKNYKIKLLTIYLQSSLKEKLFAMLLTASLLYLVQGVSFLFILWHLTNDIANLFHNEFLSLCIFCRFCEIEFKHLLLLRRVGVAGNKFWFFKYFFHLIKYHSGGQPMYFMQLQILMARLADSKTLSKKFSDTLMCFGTPVGNHWNILIIY